MINEIITTIVVSIITMVFERYRFLNEFLESNTIKGDVNDNDNDKNDPELRKRLAYRKRHKIPEWCIDVTDLHIQHYGKEDKYKMLKKRIKLVFWSIWTFYV